jgi:glycine/D-amino acid oxidase-like deaminating enzyme
LSGNQFDVVVAGAGIVGAACAHELSAAGLRVAIVEPGAIGGGATAAGMGHIAVMDDSEAQFALTRYSQLLWKALADRLPSQAEYVASGALWVAADEDELVEVRRKHAYYNERGAPVEILDAQNVAAAEPNLRPGMAGALLVRDDAVVYPPCVAQFLIDEARQHGARVILGRKIVKLDTERARLDDGSVLAGRYFVLATGAAAAELVPDVNVQPRKGHLVITDRYPGFVRHQIIELGYLKSAHATHSDSVAFNVQPRPSGQVLIGSSRQYGNADPAIDRNILHSMLNRAFEYMPGLRKLSTIRSWTGFRAATPDKLPLIGVHPEMENVFLATGHEGLGITTSLGTAKLITDLILNRKPQIPAEPYLPARMRVLHA